jgi:TPR repeat protein/serine/threonine protein kinase
LLEFVIERVLGSGGFGITYLARDTSLNRQVVIKENLPAQFAWRETTTGTVRPRHTSGGDADDYEWSMNNFLREAETLASLDHPGIVRVLRKFEANGTAYFVMPFVDGVAFDELIKNRSAEGVRFSDEELKGLLTRLLDALGYLHDRGIYHRDIKPGNILVSNDGVPALIDFGSARQRLSERSMTVVESAGYTPFEQLQTRGDVGPWSDLYALGATIEKSITSETPPKAADRIGSDPRIPLVNRRDLAGNYSRGLLASIDQALAVDGKARWQSAEQWQEVLVAPQASGLVKSAVRQSPSSFPDPVDEWERKSRLMAVLESPAWNEDEPVEQQEFQESAQSERPSRRGLVFGVAGLIILGMLVWIFNRRDPASEQPADATAQSPAAAPTSSEKTTPKPASPFEAATMAPAIWEQMAKSGDPLAQALLGDALYWGGQKNHGIQMDPAEGVKWIEKSANAGHPLGRSLMGLVREDDGKWFPRDEDASKKDYAEAVRLGLLRDAENGGPVWWTALAQVLELGKGVAADPKTAVTWYRKAAEAGYVDGMNGLAACYDTGVGVAEDDSEAVSWYRKSAEAGNLQGMTMLGSGYHHGAGVPKDSAEAVKWFRLAAEQGEVSGQNGLGLCYAEGKGVPKDAGEAVKWYRKAADQGFAISQMNLGFCYANGEGVSKEPIEATKWYRKAADQGYARAQVRLGECYADGEGVSKDPAEAVKWYQKAADQGHAEAQVLLGTAYEFGDGVTVNAKMAAKWYLMAAEHGNSEGQAYIGDCYRHGEGVLEDAAEAVKWYRLAADQGEVSAQNGLGLCYAEGKGVNKDTGEAVKWYRKAADQGFARSQLNLGFCYMNGEGVAKEPIEAVKWYRKAAESKLADAQNQLGVCYYDGNGVSQSAVEAVKWCRLAAEHGHAGAQNNLGYCYANGEGVAKDKVESFKWYQKAAELEHPAAQNNLGDCYANGNGRMKNPTDAVKWYRKAAEQGNMNAQFNLGYFCEQGNGISKDPAEAVKWYEKAGQQGHSIAQNNLGVCYSDGRGVPKNLVLAYVWTGLAAESGDAQSKKNLEVVISQMTSVQIAEAKRIGREWKGIKEKDPFAEP